MSRRVELLTVDRDREERGVVLELTGIRSRCVGMVSWEPRAERERVVDPVGLGDLAPARGVAVVLVGDRLQRVAVGDGVDLEAGDRAGGRVLAAAVACSDWVSSRSTSARGRLAVGAEHHEADGQRAADHLRALDRAPLEGHGGRAGAAAAPAARLHHLQQLDRVVLDRRVGALERGVEQELHADRPRHAAAELGLRRVGAGDGLDRPDVRLGDRVLLRVEGALDRVAAVDDQLCAFEVLRDRHRRQPIFSPEWAISRDFLGHRGRGGGDRRAAPA